MGSPDFTRPDFAYTDRRIGFDGLRRVNDGLEDFIAAGSRFKRFELECPPSPAPSDPATLLPYLMSWGLEGEDTEEMKETRRQIREFQAESNKIQAIYDEEARQARLKAEAAAEQREQEEHARRIAAYRPMTEEDYQRAEEQRLRDTLEINPPPSPNNQSLYAQVYWNVVNRLKAIEAARAAAKADDLPGEVLKMNASDHKAATAVISTRESSESTGSSFSVSPSQPASPSMRNREERQSIPI